MKSDVGENQTTVVGIVAISGAIALVLCFFAASIRSCNVAENAVDGVKDARISEQTAKADIAKYQAMAECAKARSALECEHLFEPKKEK